MRLTFESIDEQSGLFSPAWVGIILGGLKSRVRETLFPLFSSETLVCTQTGIYTSVSPKSQALGLEWVWKRWPLTGRI